MTTPLLEASGFRKSFDGVPALKLGQFRLEPGSVHALCGGNGAGKSTFLKILMGIHHRDAGTLLRNGQPVVFDNPSQALAHGISIIEQELSPVPAMTVAENIYLGREPVGMFGRIAFREMNSRAQALLDGFQFGIRADSLMMDLTVAQTQLVEIAKALSYDAEVIIMDEPTSALGEAEADQLFAAIDTLKARGKGDLRQPPPVRDLRRLRQLYRVPRRQLRRDGQHGRHRQGPPDPAGRGPPLTEEFVKENTPQARRLLSVAGLAADRGVRDVSFDLHEGEILALYGLMGSGRTEIFDRLFGLSAETAGTVTIDGRPARITTPREAIEAGLACVTEDRKRSGLVLTGDVRENLCLATLDRMSAGPVMNARAEGRAATRMIDTLNIRTASDRLNVAHLSGGNQQKVVLGSGS
ncbi:sugar ABC transporter ATP-binding protein [Paracoccus marcusii]|uniref:sugar ABC transporter ATP-binding protein n=1 Tax=Paracoccus marcusii TaxID=59779 RepID=UPI002ED4E24D|nr:sugar ABC transporter ATP-binding protein [Paracoccus marcusii]